MLPIQYMGLLNAVKRHDDSTLTLYHNDSSRDKRANNIYIDESHSHRYWYDNIQSKLKKLDFFSPDLPTITGGMRR